VRWSSRRSPHSPPEARLAPGRPALPGDDSTAPRWDADGRAALPQRATTNALIARRNSAASARQSGSQREPAARPGAVARSATVSLRCDEQQSSSTRPRQPSSSNRRPRETAPTAWQQPPNLYSSTLPLFKPRRHDPGYPSGRIGFCFRTRPVAPAWHATTPIVDSGRAPEDAAPRRLRGSRVHRGRLAQRRVARRRSTLGRLHQAGVLRRSEDPIVGAGAAFPTLS
jgi:hypothetical protein